MPSEGATVTDLLKDLYVDVHCDQCGDFAVRADVIAESQRLLADGCPGSAFECPPELFATLLEPAAVESLRNAGGSAERAALSLSRDVPINDGVRISVRPASRLDPAAIARMSGVKRIMMFPFCWSSGRL